MLKSVVLVAGLLVAVVVATGPLGVSLVTDSSVMAATVCEKCKHEKCPGGPDGCKKCPDCQKK